MASNDSVYSIPRRPVPTTSRSRYSGDLKDGSVDEAILLELRELNRLTRAAARPIQSQELWRLLLQAFGLLAATMFGIFSILAWVDANKANSLSATALELALISNQQALSSNELALLAYCLNDNSNNAAGLCAAVQSLASVGIATFASSLFSITAAATVDNAFTTLTETVTTSVQIIISGSTFETSIVEVTRYTEAPTSGIFATSPTSTTMSSSVTGTPEPHGSAGSGATSSVGRTVGIAIGATIGGIAIIGGFLTLPYLTYREKRRREQELEKPSDQTVPELVT